MTSAGPSSGMTACFGSVSPMTRPVPPGIRTWTATVRSIEAGSRPAAVAAASTSARRRATPAGALPVSAYQAFHACMYGVVTSSIRGPDDPMRISGPPGRARPRQQLRLAGREELALEVDVPVAQQRAHDRERLLEAADPVVERHAQGAELHVVPAGTETQDEPAAGDLVDRGRLLGEHERRVERGRRDERAEGDALRGLGEAGERRPRLPRAARLAGRRSGTAGGRRARSSRTRPARPSGRSRGSSGQRTSRSTSGSWTPTPRGRPGRRGIIDPEATPSNHARRRGRPPPAGASTSRRDERLPDEPAQPTDPCVRRHEQVRGRVLPARRGERLHEVALADRHGGRPELDRIVDGLAQVARAVEGQPVEDRLRREQHDEAGVQRARERRPQRRTARAVERTRRRRARGRGRSRAAATRGRCPRAGPRRAARRAAAPARGAP